MSGHVGPGNTKFDYVSEAVPSLHTVAGRRKTEIRSNRKIWREPLEVSLPTRPSARFVAGGAVALESTLAIVGICRCDG